MLPQGLRTVLGSGALMALAAAPHGALAGLVYVSSYAGTITTLKLDGSSLTTVNVEKSCGPQASWIALNKPASLLYCVDEAWDKTNGTLFAYRTSPAGTLSLIKKVGTPGGPVSTVFYGDGGKGIAVAGYAGATLTSYKSDPESLAFIQGDQWKLTKPGANPERQEAPHPHQAITDPTGDFIIVPDLGADLVRVFRVDKATLAWTPVAPLVTAPGSGPRHAIFVVLGGKTYFYLVNELSNEVAAYTVTYNADKTLSFTNFYLASTHGPGGSVPKGTKAAEIVLSPDNKFLIVSSRLEGLLKIPNFDKANSTQLASDPLLTYSIDQTNGSLKLVQTSPAGGINPRQFSINKAGTQLAVGLQGDGRVVIINRDVATGQLKDFAASANVAGEVTAAIFDE